MALSLNSLMIYHPLILFSQVPLNHFLQDVLTTFRIISASIQSLRSLYQVTLGFSEIPSLELYQVY